MFGALRLKSRAVVLGLIAAACIVCLAGQMAQAAGTGSLQVTLAPPAAVTAGARWYVDSGPLQVSGATVSGLAVGTHTLKFNTIPSWGSPASQQVTIVENTTTPATGTYTLNIFTLTVQAVPPTGLLIGSSTGHGGTTDYTVLNVANSTSVNLQAPAADPAGYLFSQWSVNGVMQVLGQKAITFTQTADTTAVARYSLKSYTLTVQSTPPVAVNIASNTHNAGKTNYTTPALHGVSINLQAPAADPGGYAFSRWMVGAVPQTLGQKSINFAITGPTTAVAQYNVSAAGRTLIVQSTPLTGVVIASSTANGGTTNYIQNATIGSFVYLRVPTVDPTGYVFVQWRLNGTAQVAGQKIAFFKLNVPTTAVAEYVAAP